MARAMSAGVLRTDVEVADVVLLSWGVAAIMDATRGSAPDAWRRYLALQLDGLRPQGAPLPGVQVVIESFRPDDRPGRAGRGSPRGPR
ncbi:MAG: hypothetical protein ACRDN0_26015 [Trebonia sp.]